MNIITFVIMAAFMVAATAWSLSQVFRGKGVWRIVHLILALSMIGGALTVYMNQGGIGMLFGMLLLVLAPAIMFIDKSPNRWLVIIQFVSGAILASGILFGAA
ncbi:MAG: hypothetical protein ACU0CA_09905 [Paracoccaceae bacterium]